MPQKCGTTSYQRAIGSELSQYNRSQIDLIKQANVLKYEFPLPLKPSDLHAPRIYYIMMNFLARYVAKAQIVTQKRNENKLNISNENPCQP